MNEELVKAWNKTVQPDDTVYFLGDMLMGIIPQGRKYLDRLHGTIHLIDGNHDRKSLTYPWFRDRFASIQSRLTIEHGDKKIGLCHYCNQDMLADHDVVLHGHTHSQAEQQVRGFTLDIGVDAAAHLYGEYRPISLDEALKVLGKT